MNTIRCMCDLEYEGTQNTTGDDNFISGTCPDCFKNVNNAFFVQNSTSMRDTVIIVISAITSPQDMVMQTMKDRILIFITRNFRVIMTMINKILMKLMVY